MIDKKQVELCDLRVLKHHEEIDPQHLARLKKEIEKAGVWTHPIVIEQEHGIVLDGHHRFEIAKSLGLKRIPVVLVDYFDESIKVCQRRKLEVSKNDVVKRAKNRNPFPYKTTKHTCILNGSDCPVIKMVPEVEISLDELR